MVRKQFKLVKQSSEQNKDNLVEPMFQPWDLSEVSPGGGIVEVQSYRGR